MTALAPVFCAVCASPVNLRRFDPALSDYVLTCGHLYYLESETTHNA
jgi:hypothetical protein